MVKQITATELKKLIANKGKIILIDTRTPNEHSRGHLEDSILIPYDEIADRWTEIEAEKDAMIIVYCRSGSRSSIAAAQLEEAGFTNIYNLEDGLIEW